VTLSAQHRRFPIRPECTVYRVVFEIFSVKNYDVLTDVILGPESTLRVDLQTDNMGDHYVIKSSSNSGKKSRRSFLKLSGHVMSSVT